MDKGRNVTGGIWQLSGAYEQQPSEIDKLDASCSDFPDLFPS